MSTLEQRLARGDRAREILENEEFNSAFEAIQQEIIEQWKSAPARDAEGREKLYLMLKMGEKFKLALQSTMETGKLAQAELQHKQSLVDRARSWIGSD
jgi:hypothetical protein